MNIGNIPVELMLFVTFAGMLLAMLQDHLWRRRGESRFLILNGQNLK